MLSPLASQLSHITSILHVPPKPSDSSGSAISNPLVSVKLNDPPLAPPTILLSSLDDVAATV